MNKNNLYYIITIDTECDKSKDWLSVQPLSFRNIYEGVNGLFQPFCDHFGIKPVYLQSPEIIKDEKSSQLFYSYQDRCELGTHLHSEYIEPEMVWNAEKTSVFQADLDYDTEYWKMKNLTELFYSRFGYYPVSFRAGRFGAGRNTLRILFRLGYRADSSLFPFHIIKTKKDVFSYFNMPIKPYYPIIQGQDADHSLIEIPMTVYSRFYSRIPPYSRYWIGTSRLMKRILSRFLGKNTLKVFSLRPSSYSFEIMREVVDSYVRMHHNDKNIFLVMMFHSNELSEGTSPYNQNKEDVRMFMDRLKRISEYILLKNAKNITMKEASDIIDHDRTMITTSVGEGRLCPIIH